MLIKNIDAWNKLVHQGEVFIYNDFGTQFPGDSPTWNTRDFNKLHHASCSQVKRIAHITEGKLTKHFFKSRKEAIDWLEKNKKNKVILFALSVIRKNAGMHSTYLVVKEFNDEMRFT